MEAVDLVLYDGITCTCCGTNGKESLEDIYLFWYNNCVILFFLIIILIYSIYRP
jgi:hypothetical protein